MPKTLDARLVKLEKTQRSEAQESEWATRLLRDLAKVYGAEGDQVQTNITPAELRQSINGAIERVYHDDQKMS